MALKFEELQPISIQPKGATLIGVSGHRIVCDPSGNGIFLVGGWNPSFRSPSAQSEVDKHYVRTVWKFNVVTRTWTQLRCDDPPGSLASHCLVSLGRSSETGRSVLLIFGGSLSYRGVAGNSNRSYQYDVGGESWNELGTSGNAPASENDYWFGQAMAKFGSYIYVATGRQLYQQAIDRVEIHRLNLTTRTWDALSVEDSESPECRVRHEIVVDEEENVYIFGGAIDFQGASFDLINIPYFDVNNGNWRMLRTFPDSTASHPEGRSCFGCVYFKGSVYIMGGWTYFRPIPEHDQRSDVLDDCWRLHLKSGQWTKLSIYLPRPIWFHAMDVDDDGVLYVFGGCTSEEYNAERTAQLWRVKLAVQPLYRLAWDCITKYAGTTMEKLSETELRDKFAVPWSFMERKVKCMIHLPRFFVICFLFLLMQVKMAEQRGRVLVYAGPDDNAEFYNNVRAILSKILDDKKYEIKQLKHTEVATDSTKSWANGIDAVIVNNDGGEKKFESSVQKAFLEYFINSGKLVFLCNAADGRKSLWLLSTAVEAEKGAPLSENVGIAFEKFAQHQPVPANLQSFQLHKAIDPNQENVIDYAVGLVRGDSDLSYMYFICEDGDTAVFVVSQTSFGFSTGTTPEKGQGKTESFWRDILRVLRMIGVEVLPITPAQAAQSWSDVAPSTDAPTSPPSTQPPALPKILVYLGPGEEEKSMENFHGLESTLNGQILKNKFDIQHLKHTDFIQSGSAWKENCAVLFVDNRDWETRFDEPVKKLLTDYFSNSGKLVLFCDPQEGRKAMWLLKFACAPNEQWPEAVGKAYEHFAQNQPVPTDLQAVQIQKKGEQRLTDLSLGLIKGANGAFTYLKCEDGDTAVFVAMTIPDVVKRGAFIWGELLRVVGVPSAASQMPPLGSGGPVVGELTRVVKFINTGAAAAAASAASLVGGIQDRVSKFWKGEQKGPISKPPNLLVYTDGDGKKFQGFSTSLRHFLVPDRYTIYQLKKETIVGDEQAPWRANCLVLFVENEKLSDDGVRKAFAEYFLKYDGRLVLFCDPADAREALWLLNYVAADQKWPAAIGEAYERFLRTGERVIPTELGRISVSGRDEECCIDMTGGFRGTPAILHFSTGCSGEHAGPTAVFVGATFDYMCMEKGEETWTEVLAGVGLQTGESAASVNVQETKAVPMAGVFFKNENLAASYKSSHTDGMIDLNSVKIRIGEQPSPELNMPFNVDEYFQHLKTKRLGQVAVYAPIVPSTIPISDEWHNKFGTDDYVLITSQQTQGIGRGGNQWLSPLGSAICSFCIHVSQKSTLGSRLSFLQHLVTLAAADSIHSVNQSLNIKIKWPNDIYYEDGVKLGGVLVKANFVKEQFVVFVGTGINVANSAPTACLNDFLPPDAKPFTPACVIAITLTRLEELIEQFQQKGADAVLPLYYKYWLHSNQKVTVAATGEEVAIVGLDQYGFLNVKAIGSGRSFTLHPDGNSFDMMANLIKAKES